MIMQVNQVVSNGRNQFEILENGLLLYRASSPFFKPGTPVGGDEVRRLILTDAFNRLLLFTDYNVFENLVASAKSKLVLEWRGRLIVGYRKEAGKKEVVSFYDGETQIGQLTKPNAVVNNCDCYLLHFLDNSLDREIVAFFTVYYDFLYHNHSGELMRGRRTDVEYTFDRYNKMFNKNFIADNFGKEENERVEQFIKDAYKSRKKK